jgi:hypothetical protein
MFPTYVGAMTFLRHIKPVNLPTLELNIPILDIAFPSDMVSSLA